MSKVVLVTGCSSGIGRDLAIRLTEAGYVVVATARRVDTLADLPTSLKLQLDVTSTTSVNEAVTETMRQYGRIDVLVNNAGYGLRAVVEEVSEDDVQKIYDVNVFGALRMVRAVAPIMRGQGSGHIINISSIAGRVVTPVNGIYSSTKFALEATSDALRWELASFGIKVILVEPGPIRTRFDETFRRQGISPEELAVSPYKALYKQVDDFSVSMRSSEYEPEIVSKVVLKAITDRKPKSRYLAGMNFLGRFGLALRDPLWESIIRRMFKV